MGKTIIITGATSGIGLEAAKQMAVPGHDLVLVGRSPSKLTEAAAACSGADSVRTFRCDFESLADTRRLGNELLAELPRIDVLCLNAGGVNDHRRLTADGIEATFAVNHLAPFLLAELLKQRLVESAPSRVVITGSVGHYRGTMDFDDLGFERGYSTMKAYSRSKLANTLYANHLGRELQGDDVAVNSVHPGGVRTNIWSGAPWWARPILALAKLGMITPAQGGATITYLATSPEVEGRTMGYYSDNKLTQPSELARDPALGDRLVEVSRKLTGLDDPA